MRRLDIVALAALAVGCGKGDKKADPPAQTPSSSGTAAPAASLVTNGAFDDGAPGLSGWDTSVGAHNDPAPGGAADSASKATIVAGKGRDGSAALELSGDAETSKWLTVSQTFAIRPGQQILLTFASRTEGLVVEGLQFSNANAVVMYYDAANKRLAIEATTPITGTTPWQMNSLATAPAPAGAARAEVGFLSSMTGTMWVDDVSVRARDVVPWSPGVAADAWDHLVDRVSATYPFSPVAAAGEKWRRSAAALRDNAIAATDRAAFADVVVDALRPLGDVHVTVKVDGRTMATVEPRTNPVSWNFGAIKAAAKETLLSEDGFGVARLEGDIGYVLIGTWGKGRGPVDRVLEAMGRLSNVKGWIIDVRVNQGGEELWARLIASRFATEATVYAKQRFRTGDGYGPWGPRVLEPDANDPDTRKVVVLQSALCMSSNEAFLAMMRALPNVTTVGVPSRGATRNPGPLYLATDITVMSSRWEAALPDGTLIENVGIAPDVLVDEPESAYSAADPMLDKALELLR